MLDRRTKAINRIVEKSKVTERDLIEIADSFVLVNSWDESTGLNVNFTVGNLPTAEEHPLVTSSKVIEILENFFQTLGHKFYLETSHYAPEGDQAFTVSAKFFSQNKHYPTPHSGEEIKNRNRALQEAIGAVMSNGPVPDLSVS